MNILLTFSGFQDPYTIGLVDQQEQPGPILSLVGAKSFDRVILISTPSTEKNTLATREALEFLHPSISIEVRDLPLHDPTDYVAVLEAIRKLLHLWAKLSSSRLIAAHSLAIGDTSTIAQNISVATTCFRIASKEATMPQSQPMLPTDRAFVVQFRAQPTGAPPCWEGRIEHVVLGQATHFHALEELLVFMSRVLAID
jgi:hypothetical protein